MSSLSTYTGHFKTVSDFTVETKLFLVMDLCVGGQFFYFLSKRDKLNEEMALFYTVEVMEALELLHS